MGDYSLGHFHFSLKRSTPKDIVESLEKLRAGDGFMIGDQRIYLGASAYHQEQTYFMTEPPVSLGYEEAEEGTRYSMTFQIKYGCPQLEAFAKWLEPHIFVDRRNKGWFGYSISEYSNTVNAFFAHTGGDTEK